MARKKQTSPESIVRDIKRRTRRKFSAEEKIKIVLEGLKGEYSILDLSRFGRSSTRGEWSTVPRGVDVGFGVRIGICIRIRIRICPSVVPIPTVVL